MNDFKFAGSSILIVEDDVLLRKQIAAYLERMEADVTIAGNIQSAKELARQLGFDFVLLDVNLPDGSGFDLLSEKVFPQDTGVIVMTGNGDIPGAVRAMKLGALDYLVKPFEISELPIVISRAKAFKRRERAQEHIRSEETVKPFFFGKSLAHLEGVLKKIIEVDNRLQTNLPPVLIQGETGTGKTTIARWIHRNGPRANEPLIEVNCSALPESIAESELFGHEKGAFTDARATRMGLFEAADGGTLFLDELPSLSPLLQAKVLTAIEDHVIRRVGGNKPIQVDVRVIAATNQDLKQLITAGKFREDLYHRLDLFRITIPPLRERGEEIIELAEIIIEQLCRKHRIAAKKLTESGKKRLLAYHWPGNVRELAHELERAIVFEDKAEIDLAYLPTEQNFQQQTASNSNDWFNSNYVFPEQGFSLEDAINRIIHHALNQTGGNVSAAARLLGVSRDYVRYRLGQIKRGGESSRT
ncbi:MAG: sigma-54-dependent transcriptional regulator [Verrucomicrobiia bacterium]|jgi:DNA-binding NtrC family response regulator